MQVLLKWHFVREATCGHSIYTVSASCTFRMPSLKTTGKERVETDGCPKAAPAEAEDSQVSGGSDQAKEDLGV